MPGKRVVLGADHAGADYKAILMADLASLGYSLTDCGVAPGTARADYPPVAAEVAGLVAGKGGDFGILICGTGVGMAIAANKVAGARAANCHTELSARYSRAHNDANLLTLGARIIGTELALAIARAFLAEPFQGGRHQARLDMIPGAYAP